MPPGSARVAVVTGANKGVGFHVAAQLVASRLFGTVILACRDPDRGGAAAHQAGGVFLPLTVGDPQSALALGRAVAERYGRCDLLVNNAAIAFKAADPTPFEAQTKPTLDVNFRGTLQVTEALLPLLAAQPGARIVNVASMAGKLKQLSPALQRQVATPTLTMARLHELVDAFEADVAGGRHAAAGWGRSNCARPAAVPDREPRGPKMRAWVVLRLTVLFACDTTMVLPPPARAADGLSKLALIAATKVLARDHPSIRCNAMCPGYCDTDMSSHRGPRPPADGAKIAVLLATMEPAPTGAFYENMRESSW